VLSNSITFYFDFVICCLFLVQFYYPRDEIKIFILQVDNLPTQPTPGPSCFVPNNGLVQDVHVIELEQVLQFGWSVVSQASRNTNNLLSCSVNFFFKWKMAVVFYYQRNIFYLKGSTKLFFSLGFWEYDKNIIFWSNANSPCEYEKEEKHYSNFVLLVKVTKRKTFIQILLYKKLRNETLFLCHYFN